MTAGGTARPLLDELHRKAEQERDAVRARANAEADAIRQAARAEADGRAAGERQREERAATEAAAVSRADAQRRANEKLLPVRAAALARVFQRASKLIEERARHPHCADAVGSLLGDALAYLSGDALRVRCAPPFVGMVERALSNAGCSGAVVAGDAGVPFGAIVETQDGTVSVDATFAGRLVRERAELAAEIAAKLVERGA